MLAAIVVTDAVGFSARMSSDEEKALKAINQDLALMSDLCELCEGQVLKSTGDGLLMYFFSAVQAVTCALEIQQAIASCGDSDEHFIHRIGIHLGDVFINQSDVMGNGVNIAARLEATSAPGEVCVSQVVYDVVKSRLNLNVTFLGPLQLKNIQEDVPAYQIHSANEDEIALPSRFQEPGKEDTQPLTAANPNEEEVLLKTLSSLGQHRNNVRIKKLIFSTCQNLWENDPAVLNQFSLKGLVGNLLQRYATYDQCKASLYKVVSTLNRKSEYAQVAEVILAALKPLFIGEPQSSGTMLLYTEDVAESPAQQPNSSYQQVAEALDHEAQASRIKKVLFCLCHQKWESNNERIAQLDTSILVEQLYQLAPTKKDLKYRLRYLLQRLNRKTQYSAVMDILFQGMGLLYQQEVDPAPVSLPGVEPANDASGARTCFNTATPIVHPEATVASLPQSPSADETQVSSIAQRPTVKDRSNLFELRLDIVKYCNPLRAKILIFSVLNGPFSGSAREWSALKAQTLDDLLSKVFDYCSTLDDLESKLTILSHCIDDPEASAQVISAITNAIKDYYPPSKPKAVKQRRKSKSQPKQPVLQSVPSRTPSRQQPSRPAIAVAQSNTVFSPAPAFG